MWIIYTLHGSVDLTLNLYCVCKCDLVNYCFCILVRGRFRVEVGVDIKHNQICRKCNLLLAYDFRCILSRVCSAICKFMSPWPHPLPAIFSCTKHVFFCLIVQTSISYHIILMYYLISCIIL